MRLALSNFDARQLRNLLRSGDRRASCEALERFEMLLLDFGLPCKLFRAAMKTYGIIGSGSTTIWLLLPRTSTIAYHDFDLYVNVNFFAEFLSWMLQNTSYITDSQQEAQWKASISDLSGFNGLYDTVTGSNGIVHVHNLIDTAKGKKIQLIVTRPSPLAVIGSFHSSTVVNALVYNGVVCVYPDLTLERRGFQLSTGWFCGKEGANAPATALSLEKYAARGFNLAPDYFGLWNITDGFDHLKGFDSHVCGEWAYCPRTLRSPFDEGTLLLPFPEYTEIDMRKTLPGVFWKPAHNGICWDGDMRWEEGYIVDDATDFRGMYSRLFLY
ncbi:hypothetical protein BKA70DRAFT_1104972 [Coprinopsis sp. MPI-PUGE-AT-0042]|nr:hypothetical protein BKA70DRAFT_1104972 [Coprinopsis sp. MPI-PUGE-AT-0042]